MFCILKGRHKDDDPSFDYRPTKAHDTFESASSEAERLARKFRGHDFCVLQFREVVVYDHFHVTTFPLEQPSDPRKS